MNRQTDMIKKLSLVTLFILLFSKTITAETIFRMPGVLEISIPTYMERNGGAFEEITDQIKKYIDVNTKSVVFHQKGLNDLSSDSFSTYARVLISYDIDPSDFGPVITPEEIPPSDLAYLNEEFKKQTIQDLSLGSEKLAKTGQGPLKLQKWLGTKLLQYSGFSSLMCSFTRSLGSNDPVYVEVHSIFTPKYLIHITISCRSSEKSSTYKSLFSILSSMKIL